VTAAFVFDGERFRPLDLAARKTLRGAAWRPDGGVAILVGNGGAAFLLEGERLTSCPTGTRHNLRGAAWSPDGKTALLVGNRGAVLILEDGACAEVEAASVENLRRVAWHPGGEYALVVGNAGTVLRYERRERRLAPLPGDRAHTLRAVAFRPDGAYALVGAYASRWAGYPRPHALYRCDGRYLQALLASDDEDDFVAVDWSAAGLALAAGYAWRPGGGKLNKAVLYDGTAWRTRSWTGPGLLLGAAWRPGAPYALAVGEGGLAARIDEKGGIEELESGTEENLIGPFWRPDGASALILKGPGDKVYTV
jgi:hypothetical protein